MAEHVEGLRAELVARTDPRPSYGAKRRVGQGGYIYVWRPGHPLAHRSGYVAEHRLFVAEAGIEIPAGHQVHHRNGDKQDNRLENLDVIPIGEHARLHAIERRSTHCPHDHEFTAENTGINPSGWRYCKQCNRDKVRAYNARKRAETVA